MTISDDIVREEDRRQWQTSEDEVENVLNLKRRLNKIGISKRTLDGRVRNAMPNAAPASKVQPSRFLERSAARIEARDQNIATESLIGCVE
jgi:hypothetical protein